MKLFQRQKVTPPTPMTDMPDGERLVTIPRLIILIVLVVILGILLTSNGAKKATAPGKAPAKSGASHNVQKAPAPPKTAAAGSNNGAQPGGNLTDTGPGDVAAWVIVTVVAATGVRYVVILRRI